jgi:hypothetical protein
MLGLLNGTYRPTLPALPAAPEPWNAAPGEAPLADYVASWSDASARAS